MQLGKDEIQKIALGGFMAIAVIWVYFAFLLGPLSQSQELARKGREELIPKIAEAKKQIKRTEDLKVAAPKAALTVKQLTASIPDGSPVAWFPPQMADFFKREGIEKASTRMNSETPDKELPGYRKISWGIDVPRVEFPALAQAVADLENEQWLAEIDGIQIETMRDDPESQRVTLTVNNIVK